MKKIRYSIDAARSAVRYHDETTAAFCLPRFQASQRCARGIREQDGISCWRSRRNQESDRVQEYVDLRILERLQVSGVFTEVLTDRANESDLSAHNGPSALAYKDKELPGHGRDYHKDGFGSPIGNWKETEISEGERESLKFESGVVVEGKVEKILRRDDKLLLITFSNCTAKLRRSRFVRSGLGDLRHGCGRQHRFGFQRRRR